MQCRSKKTKEQKLKIILRTIWVKLYWLWFSFFNTFEIKLLWAFDETSFKNLMDNMAQIVLFVLPFDQNLLETTAKFTMGWIICEFDKLWINSYCPWLKFFKNTSSSKKELTYIETMVLLIWKYGFTYMKISWSEFAICALDRNWSMFSKWAI